MLNINIENTYIGQKGYTIYKKDLSLVDQQLLKSELTAKPFTQGSPSNCQNNIVSFPIYRESGNKIYMGWDRRGRFWNCRFVRTSASMSGP